MYIDHVGINTNDMEATLQFYCGILGMRLVRTTRMPGAIEFLKGYPPEDRAKNLSTKLKIARGLCNSLCEMDLVRDGVGQKVA
jgi:catechol 2,3-dioxygenase-like lactoylglutathione lyase family enzyme